MAVPSRPPSQGGADLALEIGIDDPGASDIVALVQAHLAEMHGQSPLEHVHAMEPEALRADGVQFYSARCAGELVAIGALKLVGPGHVEIKSMRTADRWRRRGAGACMLAHLLEVARAQGYKRVSLETGTKEYFAPARALYAKAGFVPCAPFASYTDNPYSVCMTMELF
ncbi:MAG TPA: GNAT family N-acetyltransferase [Acidimicrobiales bacterium]|nr:GNAT family N-acetyltransferase [Acidimicrobiales bacterium]